MGVVDFAKGQGLQLYFRGYNIPEKNSNTFKICQIIVVFQKIGRKNHYLEILP